MELSSFLSVQEMPSGEVRMTPFSPTATSREPVQVMEAILWLTSNFSVVHVPPSGEVRMVSPTATYREPVQAMDVRDLVDPEFRSMSRHRAMSGCIRRLQP